MDDTKYVEENMIIVENKHEWFLFHVRFFMCTILKRRRRKKKNTLVSIFWFFPLSIKILG